MICHLFINRRLQSSQNIPHLHPGEVHNLVLIFEGKGVDYPVHRCDLNAWVWLVEDLSDNVDENELMCIESVLEAGRR